MIDCDMIALLTAITPWITRALAITWMSGFAVGGVAAVAVMVVISR